MREIPNIELICNEFTKASLFISSINEGVPWLDKVFYESFLAKKLLLPYKNSAIMFMIHKKWHSNHILAKIPIKNVIKILFPIRATVKENTKKHNHKLFFKYMI